MEIAHTAAILREGPEGPLKALLSAVQSSGFRLNWGLEIHVSGLFLFRSDFWNGLQGALRI